MTAQGRHFLQIPGPSPVPDRVLRAMDMPVIDHRSAQFAELGKVVLEGCQKIFKTAGPVKSSAAIVKDRVFIGSDDGNVYALDASNGNLVNKYVLGDSISSAPVVIGDSVVVATSVASTDPKKQKGKIFIINTADNSHKELDLPSNEDINAPLFTQGDNIYIHTSKDNLYMINTAATDIGKPLFNLSTVN